MENKVKADMSESLDKKIFDSFIKNVQKKGLLSPMNIDELKRFIGKIKVTAEDWDLLIDKNCFPPQKEAGNGN